MFAAAEAVVGAPVPQLANIAFCPATALIVALSPDGVPDPFHAALAARCGLRYAEIFGPVVDEGADGIAGRFRIQPDQLRGVLDLLLPRSTGLGKASGHQGPVVAFEAFQPIVSYPDHQGEHHLAFLQHLHRMLRPRSYLEIGTQQGATLQLADCPSVAIDPFMMLEAPGREPRPGLSLFRMSSDTFFAQHDPATYLGGPIELAFLNGPKLHLEVMLRDFIAVERHATPRSVIVINHVLPPDIYMATRDRLDGFRRSRSDHPDWWAGDVWKIIAVLQRYRPELTIDLFDAAPTVWRLSAGPIRLRRRCRSTYAPSSMRSRAERTRRAPLRLSGRPELRATAACPTCWHPARIAPPVSRHDAWPELSRSHKGQTAPWGNAMDEAAIMAE